ncbi:MAG TPA: N-acetyl sugar amidotransferase [Novosphingobium sp.]|nr:N-acetyl sugar amidotransferase [Novosphingobium sp.]
MRTTPYRQCVRCVMDTSDPEIRFAGDGTCNHCTRQLARMAQLVALGRAGSQHLDAAIERIKRIGKGRRYDAVLGISGGVDSSFLALFLKARGVRTLLVHMDNGWDTAGAVRNIGSVAAKTGFDYASHVLDWAEFRALQLAFLKASVVEAETPTDVAIAGAIHRIARRHGVRTIISASNEASEGILPKLWHYDAKDIRYLRGIYQQFAAARIRHLPTFGFATQLYYKLVARIGPVYLLNYLEYDRASALAQLNAELDWHDYGGKHHESLFTKFVQSYLLPVKFDLDYRKATFSSLICAGRMTRQAALEQLAEPPTTRPKSNRRKLTSRASWGLHGTNWNGSSSSPAATTATIPTTKSGSAWFIAFTSGSAVLAQGTARHLDPETLP